MDFIKIEYSDVFKRHIRDNCSSAQMCILASFLTTEVWCFGKKQFKDWAVADKEAPNAKFGYGLGCNATYLEQADDGFIYIYDGIGGDPGDPEIPPLKISCEQFVMLLDEWQKKVLDLNPKSVIIKHENDEFIIETSD